MKPDINFLVNSVDPEQLQLIRIHTVFSAICELIIINQNMKYGIFLLNLYIVYGQVNRNFQLVLNEIGPGWTSRAWYFHSPAQ